MQFLYGMIASENNAAVSAALRILTAMVGTGVFVARHVYKTINWKFKPLERLLEVKKPRKHARQSTTPAVAVASAVRAQFIRLAIAFLRSNDSGLIQELLQVKSFIPEVRKRERIMCGIYYLYSNDRNARIRYFHN